MIKTHNQLLNFFLYISFVFCSIDKDGETKTESDVRGGNGSVSIGCGPLASSDEDEKLEGGYASLKELVAELYNEHDEAAERSVA